MSHFSLYNGKLEEKGKTLVGYFALTRSVHPVFTISATYQRLHIYLSMRGVTFLARVAIDQRHCTGFVDYHIMYYMCIPWVFLTVFGLWVFRRHTFLLKSVCARREGGQSWVCAPTLMLQHIYAQKGSIMKSHHVWVSIRICFGKYIHTFREMANHWQFIRESLSDGPNECVAHTYFYRHTHTHRLEHALNIRNIIP